MAFDRARDFLRERGFEDRIREFEVSSATVALAAEALGCEPARIAKTLSFMGADGPILVVAAGDARIDNAKFKQTFHTKAKMLAHDDVETLIGHAVGGVCPFGVNSGVKAYADESLKRFDIVYPACGSGNSAVRLTVDELAGLVGGEWVDVCKL